MLSPEHSSCLVSKYELIFDIVAQVPKMLGALRRAWAPEAFIVSFKLETDEGLLISKVLITQLAMRFTGVDGRSIPLPCPEAYMQATAVCL